MRAAEAEADSDRLAKVLEAHFVERPAARADSPNWTGGVPVEIVDEEFCRTLFDDPEARRSQLVAETWAGNVGRFEDPGLLVNLSPARRRRAAGAVHVRRAHP